MLVIMIWWSFSETVIAVYSFLCMYGAAMEENFKNGLKRREQFDKAAIKLSFCLPVFEGSWEIIRDVLDCILSKKDLSKLCM